MTENVRNTARWDHRGQLGMASYQWGAGLGCSFLSQVSFLHSFSMSTCYLLGTVLHARDTARSKTGRNTCSCGNSTCSCSSWAHSCPEGLLWSLWRSHSTDHFCRTEWWASCILFIWHSLAMENQTCNRLGPWAQGLDITFKSFCFLFLSLVIQILEYLWLPWTREGHCLGQRWLIDLPVHPPLLISSPTIDF